MSSSPVFQYLTPVLLRGSNGCPDGTSLGTAKWNNAVFLICDAAFNKETADIVKSNGILAGEIIAGLLVPGLFLIIVVWYITKRYPAYRYSSRLCPLPCFVRKVQPAKEEPFLNPLGVLSEQAQMDFMTNKLTDTLKQELMVLRVEKGQDMRNFVKQAQKENAFQVGEWIDKLGTGVLPVQPGKKEPEVTAILYV